MFAKFASISKALVSAVGVGLTALSFADKIPFLPGPWHVVIGVAIAVLTPVTTWAVPNKQKAASPA